METQFTKREFAKTQTTLLTKSMLIAGIFFIIIGLGSYGFSYVFKDPYAISRTVLPIMLLVMFAGMLISVLWTKVLWSGKAGFTTGLIYALYVACESVAFGYLFAMARFSGVDYVWSAFLIAGGVFAICALIAKIMSTRGIMTMGKMMGAAGIAMSVMLIVAMIMMIVTLAMNNWTVARVTDIIFDLVMFGMAFITFGYVIIDIWSISKTSEFANYVGEDLGSGYVWFVGYKLLSDLLAVVLIVIWFLLKIARRAE